MPADPPLTVSLRQLTPESATVSARGEVDAATIGVLSAALERAVMAYPLIVLDLSGVTFLGAAGANLIARVRARGHRLELTGARGATREVLLIAGLGPEPPIPG